MKKKMKYNQPLTKIYVPCLEDICGVKLSEAGGNTGYDDISDIGYDDGGSGNVVPPTSNSIWFDGEE
jgi:hypothetical protein